MHGWPIDSDFRLDALAVRLTWPQWRDLKLRCFADDERFPWIRREIWTLEHASFDDQGVWLTLDVAGPTRH